MEFVKVERQTDPYGFHLSALDYQRELPRLQGVLPSGAWAFASEPGHYDFYSVRCVKDLTMAQVLMMDEGQLSLEIAFEPNRWKHDGGLKISYSNVVRFVTEFHSKGPEPKALGNLMLDEILPNPSGCSHELVFTGGSMHIICSDLEAAWEV
jgi:hypothetical protein